MSEPLYKQYAKSLKLTEQAIALKHELGAISRNRYRTTKSRDTAKRLLRLCKARCARRESRRKELLRKLIGPAARTETQEAAR